MKTRNLLASLMALLILTGLAACSSDKSADADELLKTVPSDASMVAVMNVSSILENAGCKVDGASVTPSESIKSLLASSGDVKEFPLAPAFFNGESGIDPSVAVCFRLGYYQYLTGVVADPSKFKEAVKNAYGSDFTTTDGIDIAGGVALAANQFWVNLSQNSIDPNEIKHFTALDETQSFTSNDYAKNLLTIKTDIAGWGNIQGLLNTTNLPFQQKASIQMAVATAFKDASFFSFTTDLQKGQAGLTLSFLNSKGEPAKFQFPTATIDATAMKGLDASGSILIAAAIPAKMIQQLQKETSGKPSMLGLMASALGTLDGTTAFVTDDKGDVAGFISTNGTNSSDLNQMLASYGLTAKMEGKVIRISKGSTPTGSIKPTDLEDAFKGAMVVCAANAVFTTASGAPTPALSGTIFSLCPEKGSLILKATLKSAEADKNFLETVIAAAKKTTAAK